MNATKTLEVQKLTEPYRNQCYGTWGYDWADNTLSYKFSYPFFNYPTKPKKEFTMTHLVTENGFDIFLDHEVKLVFIDTETKVVTRRDRLSATPLRGAIYHYNDGALRIYEQTSIIDCRSQPEIPEHV